MGKNIFLDTKMCEIQAKQGCHSILTIQNKVDMCPYLDMYLPYNQQHANDGRNIQHLGVNIINKSFFKTLNFTNLIEIV